MSVEIDTDLVERLAQIVNELGVTVTATVTAADGSSVEYLCTPDDSECHDDDCDCHDVNDGPRQAYE